MVKKSVMKTLQQARERGPPDVAEVMRALPKPLRQPACPALLFMQTERVESTWLLVGGQWCFQIG